MMLLLLVGAQAHTCFKIYDFQHKNKCPKIVCSRMSLGVDAKSWSRAPKTAATPTMKEKREERRQAMRMRPKWPHKILWDKPKNIGTEISRKKSNVLIHAQMACWCNAFTWTGNVCCYTIVSAVQRICICTYNSCHSFYSCGRSFLWIPFSASAAKWVTEMVRVLLYRGRGFTYRILQLDELDQVHCRWRGAMWANIRFAKCIGQNQKKINRVLVSWKIAWVCHLWGQLLVALEHWLHKILSHLSFT